MILVPGEHSDKTLGVMRNGPRYEIAVDNLAWRSIPFRRVVKFNANLAIKRMSQMKLARDIMSLSTFKRDSNKVMRQMKRTKEPVVLTVNGKAAVVVQDAESYQKLLELKERAEVVETLRERLASSRRQKGRTAEDFFTEFFAKNNIAEG